MRMGAGTAKKLLESSAPLPPSLHHVHKNLFLYSPPLPAARLQSSRAGSIDKVLVDPSLSRAKKSHVGDNLSDITEARNLRAAPVHNISNDDLAQIVSRALQVAFSDRKSGVKEVQRVANTNERTAKNWWAGKNAPDGLNLLKLMAEVPELRAEVRRLTAMETDMDPHFERAMSDAMVLFQKMLKGKP